MSKYEELSKERKDFIKQGLVPKWMITGGYQMYKEKYDYETNGRSMRGQFERIAETAAKHLPLNSQKEGYVRFFNLMWNGWLSLSTPVLANMGTERGLPVSCAGSVVHDSVDGFYSSLREAALMTKWGFGTSVYLGDIRPRGSIINGGGKATGLVPVFDDFVRMTMKVSQGGVRRGAIACYVPINHGDFDELVDHITANPDSANVGWNFDDADVKSLNNGDFELTRRFQRAIKLKLQSGKGYFFFPEKANRHAPQMYKDLGLSIKASNLCSEIALHSDHEHTFSCILSSMNLATYDEWKDTDAVFWALCFLDCVCEEFLTKARNISGLEKVVRFTEKGRALGLGTCGLHSYMQDHNIVFDSLDAQFKMVEMYKHIQDEATRATQWLAQELGEPEWCKGYGVRNTHLTTAPPTKSTALIMGGVSEGVSPFPANTYSQLTAAGEVDRLNPSLVEVMKTKGTFTREEVEKIIDDEGSVRSVDWLNDDEKKVFKTAFEINQNVLLRYAALRNKFIDQAQSINLFIPADTPEDVIAELHEDAFNNEDIISLYYLYTKSGYSHQSKLMCESCQ